MNVRYTTQRRSSVKPGKEFNTFLGQVHPDAANYLNVQFGQLLYNKNLEYRYSQDNVYLQTKRGSKLIGDIVDTNFLGAAIYTYNATDNFYIWMTTSGDLKAMDEFGAINTIKSGLTTSEKTNFYMYGQGVESTLYGANKVDGIFKIYGAIPTWGSVINTGIVDISFSAISGRMIAVVDHKVLYSDIQNSESDLSNLENYGSDRYAIVSPDNGSGFNKVIDNGRVTFLFKDSGIWYFPNANENTTDFKFPKLENMPGTLSPQTVCLAKYGNSNGIIYLASDKTVRFITYQLIDNAGTLPSLTDTKSQVISDFYKPVLDKINTNSLAQCVAQYYDGQYILNYASDGANSINSTIVLDTEKLYGKNGPQKIPQPFWYFSENMDYLKMVVRQDDQLLIGFHKNGYISSLFAQDYYVEDVPNRIDSSGSLAIDWGWYTGWIRYYQNEVELVELILNWQSNNLFPISFYVNSFTTGRGIIPDFQDSKATILKQKDYGNAYWDENRWDESVYANKGQVSQNTGVNANGDYFIFGSANINKDSAASFYGFIPYFKSISRSGLMSIS